MSSSSDNEAHPPQIVSSGAKRIKEEEYHIPRRTVRTTTIDGCNLWSSWTRNYTTPLLAFWDLMDNAIDASCPDTGRIIIHPDKDDSDGVRGMVVTNCCKSEIPSLRSILKAYNSKKGTNNLEIGENGVGLKQGCATLSDLSFVLTKNGSTLSLGVIAKHLQKQSGVYLPSFQFTVDSNSSESDEDDGNQDSIFADLSILAEKDPDMKDCFTVYGNGILERGLEGIAKHFYNLLNNWEPDHVFSLVLYHLKHSARQGEESTTTLRTQPAREEQAHTVATFLSDIEEALPKQYLHIPESFTVEIGNIVNPKTTMVEFSYWQRRLVEMASFKVVVNMQEDQSKVKDFDNKTEPESDSEYVLNVYCGFDAMRCASNERKTAVLLCHSRRAGRLIKQNNDARGELHLENGGTSYCQGLVIIVDDFQGHLPLNPTKQDFAFGERVHGDIHYKNMVLWVGAMAKVYWSYHHERTGGSKEQLTQLVKNMAKQVKRYCETSNDKLQSISECSFSTIEGVSWRLWNQTGTKKLVLVKRQLLKLVPGPNTVHKFPASATIEPAVKIPPIAKKKKKKPTKTPKAVTPNDSRKRKTMSDNEGKLAQKRAVTGIGMSNQHVIDVDFVPREELVREKDRVKRYKDKARHYMEKKDKYADQVIRLSKEVARLKGELEQALGGSDVVVMEQVL